MILETRSFSRRSVITAIVLALFISFSAKAQAAVSVSRTSGTNFYTDTSTTSPDVPKCGYLSFNVNTSAAIADAYVTIGSFSGGYFSLGGGDDGVEHFGPMVAGQTKPVFFYLCSSYTTLNSSPTQGYQVKVYNGNPAAGGALINSIPFSQTINNNVIQANPNQVNTIFSGPNPPVLGGLITMTVDGDTGTIGCVNPPSTCSGAGAGPLAFTPASFTSWRADAFEMVGSNITLSGGNSGSYDNALYIDNVPASATTHYVANYYFRAMSPTGVTTTLSPVSYLASGTQIKHTTLTSGAYSTTGTGGLQPVDSPQATVLLSKAVSSAKISGDGGQVTYTITATNSGQETVTLDSFVDTLPANVTYVSGTSTFNGTTSLPDPTISGNTLTWSSSFAIPGNNGTGKLSFKANLPATPGTYTNSATARIGSTVIDTTLSLNDSVPATVSTLVLTPPTLAETISPTALAINSPAQMTLTISNPNSGDAMNGIALSDSLPNGLTFASAVTTNCPGPNSTTPPTLTYNGTSFQLGNASLPAQGSCTITATVTSTANGSYTNTVGPVTSTDCGTGKAATGVASATVTYTALPTISKSFDVSSIPVKGTATVTFTINSSLPVSGLTFDDLFPSGMVTANPVSVSPSSPCGGTLYAWDGTTQTTLSSGGDPGIRLSGGSITGSAGGSCTFSLKVTAAKGGKYDNTATGVKAAENTVAGPVSNTATLYVLSPPSLTKSFAPGTIDKGNTSTLAITLSNSNPLAITGVKFTDSFPSGVTIAGSGTAAGCPSGAVTCTDCPSGAVSNTSASLSFSGNVAAGSTAAPATCTVRALVTSSTVNASPGYQNVIPAGAVTTDNASSNTAAATGNLVVNATPSISKRFDFTTQPGTGTMIITITNNHTSGVGGLSFTDLFPSNMSVAIPLSYSSTCGGTLYSWDGTSQTAIAAGAPGISLSGGQIAVAGGTCTVSINLSVNQRNVYLNQTSGVTVTSPFSGTGSASNVATWIAPGVSKAFSPKYIGPNEISHLSFSITNPSLDTGLTSVALTDTYPTYGTLADGSSISGSIINAATPNISPTGCGGATITAAPNGTGISISSLSLAPGATCSFTVDVQATNTTPATYNNTTGKVSAAEGLSAPGSDTLVVINRPTIAKSFTTPATFSNGSATTLMTLTVTNHASLGISNLSFSDTFPSIPAQMHWVSTVSNSCNGTLTDASGAALVSGTSTGMKLANGSISTANGSCTIQMNVSVPSTGTYSNTTSGATSSANSSPGPVSNTATLVAALSAPTVTKSFGSSAFQTGKNNRLTILVTNSSTDPINGFSFNDDYPGTLVNSYKPTTPFTNSCGGNVTADAGTGKLYLDTGKVPGSGSCQVGIDVTSSDSGNFPNIIPTSKMSSGNALPPQADASATTNAFLPPTVTKAFGIDAIVVGGTTTLTLAVANPSTNVGAITGVQVDDGFPSGMSLQNTAFTFTPSGCGSVTRTTGDASAAGDAGVRLSVASLAKGESCQVQMNVTSSVVGNLNNITNAPAASGPTGLTGSAASASVIFYALPSISMTKTAYKTVNGSQVIAGNADPGQIVLYTVQVTNTGGPGTNVVLTDTLSPYSYFYYGGSSPFTLNDTSGSGLSVGTPQYSNSKGSSWTYSPSSPSGTPSGYDGAITNWRLPINGTLKAGGSFSLTYQIMVK